MTSFIKFKSTLQIKSPALILVYTTDVCLSNKSLRRHNLSFVANLVPKTPCKLETSCVLFDQHNKEHCVFYHWWLATRMFSAHW